MRLGLWFAATARGRLVDTGSLTAAGPAFTSRLPASLFSSSTLLSVESYVHLRSLPTAEIQYRVVGALVGTELAVL
jgi:hypothetical protein